MLKKKSFFILNAIVSAKACMLNIPSKREIIDPSRNAGKRAIGKGKMIDQDNSLYWNNTYEMTSLHVIMSYNVS